MRTTHCGLVFCSNRYLRWYLISVFFSFSLSQVSAILSRFSRQNLFKYWLWIICYVVWVEPLHKRIKRFGKITVNPFSCWTNVLPFVIHIREHFSFSLHSYDTCVLLLFLIFYRWYILIEKKNRIKYNIKELKSWRNEYIQ